MGGGASWCVRLSVTQPHRLQDSQTVYQVQEGTQREDVLVLVLVLVRSDLSVSISDLSSLKV